MFAADKSIRCVNPKACWGMDIVRRASGLANLKYYHQHAFWQISYNGMYVPEHAYFTGTCTALAKADALRKKKAAEAAAKRRAADEVYKKKCSDQYYKYLGVLVKQKTTATANKAYNTGAKGLRAMSNKKSKEVGRHVAWLVRNLANKVKTMVAGFAKAN